MSARSANATTIHLAWFESAYATGPAIGTAETLVWTDFVSIVCDYRRVGPKDTTCLAATRFKPKDPDGLHHEVRRVARDAIARTGIALDIECNKATAEVPPPPVTVAERLASMGMAAVVYTSHSHTLDMPRYRVVAPLSAEIDPTLPACEVWAEKLALAGVIDQSKRGPAAIFYLPTAADEYALDHHQALAVDGNPIDAEWLVTAASALQAERDAEQERIAAEAHAAAAARLQQRLAAGFDPTDSIIEKIRARLDLRQVLAAHGYDQSGTKWRHPNSSSGLYGADIKTFGGIDRIYSHNGTDPLHRDNLPSWCTATAIDVFDATCILDFGGDRQRALRELAQRFNLNKATERKVVAKLLFQLIRDQAPQETIEADAYAEGERLGLTPAQVCEVARWVLMTATTGKAA